MKKYLLFSLICIKCTLCYGQQFALYNTRTLFDSFENPSQKAFYPDSSRTYAFNFFIPNLNVSAQANGPANPTIRKLYTGVFNATGIPYGEDDINKLYVSENTYLAMFRIFKNAYLGTEKGFSWQIRTDATGTISNATIGVLHTYKIFESRPYPNVFNNNFRGMSFHQFGFSSRTNYGKKLGFGYKLSYLSGIAYSKLDIESSSLTVDVPNKTFQLDLNGRYRSNFLLTEPGKLYTPGVKNPGIALDLSINYKLRRAWYILANMKDLGFIKWRNQPYTYNFNRTLTFMPEDPAEKNLSKKIQDDLFSNPDRKKFTTLLTTRAEFLINKDLGFYQPNLILTKNIFNGGGNIVLVNTIKHEGLNLSLLGGYNLGGFSMFGGQIMVKSPNTEFFIGSDQMMKTYSTTKGFLTSSEAGKGNTAVSVYLGFSAKFGKVKERAQNASYIPMNDERPNFFKRLSKKIFKKKRFEGQERE